MPNRFTTALSKVASSITTGSDNSSASSRGAQSMCNFCGQYPKNPGFEYCSRACGVSSARQSNQRHQANVVRRHEISPSQGIETNVRSSMQPTFSGERGQDPAAFIRAIQTIAFAQGRQRDNDWQADYAATCLAGPAMQWYCSLRDEERSSWSDLRRALLQRFSASLVPTSPPAAAPVFAAMPRGPEAPAARPPLYTENATPRPPAIGRVTENKVPTSKSPILFCGSTQPFFGFTNLSPHEVQYRGKTYYTAEHLFQAFKFMDDRPAMAEYAEYIRTVGRDPREAVSEALRFSSVVRTDWPDVNILIMDEVITLKFSQHPTLREELLATGGAELIFNSGEDDEFWGNGADGRGGNELGKALMRLRSELVHVI